MGQNTSMKLCIPVFASGFCSGGDMDDLGGGIISYGIISYGIYDGCKICMFGIIHWL